MSRIHYYLLGPEAALGLASLLLFWFCSRHNSGEGRDTEIMEKSLWIIPFVLTAIAFATILVPGAKNWLWLGRAIGFSYLASFVCGYRVICGFGSGSKGQDVAMILIIMLSSVAIALASAISGAMILAAQRPGFANWFQAHPVFGSILTGLAAIPIGIVFGLCATVISTILLSFYCEITKR